MTSEPLNATPQVNEAETVNVTDPPPVTKAAACNPVPIREKKQERVKPVQSTLDYTIRALLQLSRLQRAIYFVSQGTAQGEILDWLTEESVDACRELVALRSANPAWLERTQANFCLTAWEPVTKEVGRFAFRLRRIVVEIVSTWVAPFLKPSSMNPPPEPPILNAFLVFSAAPPPRQFILDLGRYLERIDLPELAATADMLLAQINDPFIPTPRQCQLYDVLKRDGPLKKEALARRLGVDASDLYKSGRFGLAELMNRGFVENVLGRGYVVAAEMNIPRMGRSTSGTVVTPELRESSQGDHPQSAPQPAP